MRLVNFPAPPDPQAEPLSFEELLTFVNNATSVEGHSRESAALLLATSSLIHGLWHVTRALETLAPEDE